MKKWLALLLVFAMLASTLLSCGTDTVTPEPGEPDGDTPSAEEPGGNTPDHEGNEGEDETAEHDRYAPFVGTHESAAAQRKEYELVAADGYFDGPYIVLPVYPSEQTIVANVIATDQPYRADPTGQTDSTAAIQAALDACGAMGGGTVFLPVGEYLVTSTINIPVGVVLHGDWQDPDLTDDPQYGTVILAKPAPLEGEEIYNANAKPLFDLSAKVSGNNGIVGITVYYPEQDAANVVPYGYTVYGTIPRAVTVRNVTLINSYRALGMGPEYETGYEELIQIENVRVTALSQGYKAMRSSEIGYTVDLRISPRYWANAAARYACADAAALRDHCRAHAVGMEMQQLDMNQYTDLFIEGCHTAMLLQKDFWGGIYGLDIRDSVYGVVGNNVRSATGVVIANGAIEADEYAVLNRSTNRGTIKLTDVEIKGEGDLYAVEGARILVDEESDLTDYDIEYGSYKQPAPHLYVADLSDYHEKQEDATDALQAVLDSAEATGGIVYIPNGVYSFYTPLYVPAGVELRGAAMTLARDRADVYYEPTGTCLLSYVTNGDFITLAEGAGVYGLRIFYGSFDNLTALTYLERGMEEVETCVAIRGTGKDVYCLNTVIANAFVGVDFTDCDNHLIKQLFGCTFNNFIRAGGKNGHIEQVLANQTFTYHQPFNIRGLYDTDLHDSESWKTYNYAITQDKRFSLIRDTLLRGYCDTVSLKDAENETMVDVFMYGCRRIVSADNSSATCYNVIADWHSMKGMFLLKNGSEIVAMNPYHTVGNSHEVETGSSLTLYNRMQGLNFASPALLPGENEDILTSDVIDLADVCDGERVDERITGVTLNTDPDYVIEGSGSLKVTSATAPVRILFDPVNAKTLGDRLYLHLWFYMDETINADWTASSLVLANTANGAGETYRWPLTSYITQDGWNELWLPLGEGWMGKGEMEVGSLQYLCFNQVFNHLKVYPQMYLDDIYLCALDTPDDALTELGLGEAVDYASPVPHRGVTPSRVMLHNGDTTEGLTGNVKGFTTVTTQPDFVKEGSGALKVDVKANIYLEMTFPATDICAYDKDGYLHMWLYVSDISLMGGAGQIELTSGGTCDVGEKNWRLSNYVLESGWNELWLPLAAAVNQSPVPYEPSHVNYIRIYSGTNTAPRPTVYVDDIYVCNVADGSLYHEGNTGKTGSGDPALRLPLVHSCDNMGGIKVATLNTDPTYVKEGTGSLAATTNDVRLLYSCADLDITEYMDGYLHLWIYVEDVSALRAGQIELTSSGTCDHEELGWPLLPLIQNGWNELYLPLASGGVTGGEIDPKSFNYMRIYALAKDGVRDLVPMYFDDIRFTDTMGD